jgi:hypothetical protein
MDDTDVQFRQKGDEMTQRSILLSGLTLGFILTLHLAAAMASSAAAKPYDVRQQAAESTAPRHPYVGMWVTEDDRIRHELLPDGRYDEARGTRESAYQGRYEVRGHEIDYWDDSGFTADGVFVDNETLHHGGMIFRRR